MVSLLHSGHLRAVDSAPGRAALLPRWEGSMGAVRKPEGNGTQYMAKSTSFFGKRSGGQLAPYFNVCGNF